ncbi:hypothetical protein O0L34_g19117 [Tuta absoluta]|nr:hypothetical protein O0L34_g19117 [Tuta absoluta]
MFQKLDEKLDRQTKTITVDVTKNVTEALSKKIDSLTEENKVLKSKITKLEQEVNYLEREKRNNNLLFFSIEENEKSEGELVDYIKEMIIDTGIHINSQEISNVSWIGRWGANKNRPVAVSFTTTWKKHMIQHNKLSLPEGIYIREDYSKEVLEKRKQLQPIVEEERKKGNRAFIVYDKLVVKTPKENTRDKRKREESGSPKSSIQKKINTNSDSTHDLHKQTTKDNMKTNILNYIERKRQDTGMSPQPSKNQ